MTKRIRTYEPLHEGPYFGIRIYRNLKSKFQPSFVGFTDDSELGINLSGFPSKQLDELITDETNGSAFNFGVDKKHSIRYNRDYFVLYDIEMLTKKETHQATFNSAVEKRD